VFKDRRLRRVFGAKRCDITGEGKRVDKLRIIKVIVFL